MTLSPSFLCSTSIQMERETRQPQKRKACNPFGQRKLGKALRRPPTVRQSRRWQIGFVRGVVKKDTSGSELVVKVIFFADRSNSSVWSDGEFENK